MENNINFKSILLSVEDSESDVRLIKESLRDANIDCQLNFVIDGEEAMAFLRREGKFANAPRPDLILLDLNLPKKNGRQVLAEVKADMNLRRIPVAILTSSASPDDIHASYDAGANCYVTKPISFDEFSSTMQRLVKFWLEVAQLPEN